MTTAVGTGDRVVAAVYAVARHRIAGPAVIVAGAVATGALVWFADPTTPGGIIPPCPTNALLHLNCPGCGTSRMLYSLMHGDFGAAVSYNAFGLVALVLLAAAFVTYTLGLWKGRRVRGWQHLRYAPMVLLVATLAWAVVRNLPFPPFEAWKV